MKILFISFFMVVSSAAMSQTLVPFLMKNGKYRLVDSATMKEVSDREYSDIVWIHHGYPFFAQLGHRTNWALLDRTGKEITGFIYQSVFRFVEGVASVSLTLGERILIDTTGKQIGEPAYRIGELQEGMILISRGRKYGFADKTMKVVIPIEYDDAYYFHEGLARVVKNGKTGFINKEGKVVVELKYDEAEDFLQGNAVVKSGNKQGFIDTKGNEICKIGYDRAYNEKSDFLVVGNQQSDNIFDNKYQYVDRKGKPITPMIYDFAYKFQDGAGWVKVKDHLELIDKKGTKLLTLDKFDNMYGISEGMTFFVIKKGLPDAGKIVLATSKGKVVGTEVYDGRKRDFINGVAMVRKGEKYGFIDKTGKALTPFVYDDCFESNNGLVVVIQGPYKFYMDAKCREYREK